MNQDEQTVRVKKLVAQIQQSITRIEDLRTRISLELLYLNDTGKAE